MKPWTWKELGEKMQRGVGCDAFVKKYGPIGAVALELASRIDFPDTANEPSWLEFTKECDCEVCKQWHAGQSDEEVRQLYELLYRGVYDK